MERLQSKRPGRTGRAASLRVRGPLALLLAASLAACGGEAPAGAGGSAAAATRDTVDGVPRVGYAADGAPRLAWSADTVAVLGDAFGDSEQQFDRVTPGGVAGDAAGDVFILDGSGARVLEFTAEGRFARTFARKGRGPGELDSPTALAVGAGDSLWILDPGNTRVTVLPQGDGEARDVALDLSHSFPGMEFALVPGGFVQTVRPFSFPGMTAGRRPGARMGGDSAGAEPAAPGIPVRRFDASGTVVATLWRAPEPKRDQVTTQVGTHTLTMSAPRGFEPQLQWAPLPDGGIVVSDTAAYLLHVVDSGGHEVLRIRRDPPPRATTDADRDAARQRTIARARGARWSVTMAVGGASGVSSAPGPSALAEQQARAMTFAAVIPRIAGVRVDRRGRIWVGVSEEHPDSADRIDIYDRGGSLLGELRGVPLPDAFTGDDVAAVLSRDEDDVQHVTLLRLREGA